MHAAHWILGFSKLLRRCSTIEAELWAIILGLRLTRDEGSIHLKVETDFHQAFMINECDDLLKQGGEVEMRNIYREMNRVVDYMTKLSLANDSTELVVWPSPTRGID